MSAAAKTDIHCEDARSAAVSDEVARTAAEALERLQRAADKVAADAAQIAATEAAPKATPPLKVLAARASAWRVAAFRSDWSRAAAASGLCAAVAFAAIMGLRDGAGPDARRLAASESAALARQSAEDARKLQDMQSRMQALSDEVRELKSRLQKQAEETHAAQTRAAAAATANAQAGTRVEKMEREVAARFERVERDGAAKLDQHNTRIERIERLVADPVVTSSIPKTDANPPAAIRPNGPPDATTAAGYVLRGVNNGIATVQTRNGLVEVGPGDMIPGVGRVRAIRKIDGRWVVVMRDGMIDGD